MQTEAGSCPPTSLGKIANVFILRSYRTATPLQALQLCVFVYIKQQIFLSYAVTE
jgi:hypothetical protein